MRLRGQVGTTVGLFVKTLPDAERERLLRSTPGDNFLRFAAESNCRKICFAPAISHHINLRWSGELMSALETGEGSYRWGGRLPLTPRQRWLLGGITPLVWLANLLLLPAVAVYPPLANACGRFVDRFGVQGVDVRDSPPRPEGKPGYSPTMRIWWRSLVLFDVPIFKYVTAQLGSLGLLSLLLHVAPCFDWDNHQACFSDGGYSHAIGDPFGLSGSILQALDIPLPTADGHEGTADYGKVVGGRMLRARSSKVDRNPDGEGSSGGLADDAFTEWQVPNLFGMSREAVYFFLMLYACSVLVATLRKRPSIASALTYASAVASLLVMLFLGLDLLVLYRFNEMLDTQPSALSLATFLLWLDVARALLLKTFTCGPSVLMLLLMFRDVAIFLVLAVAIAIGFALALFFNNMLRALPASDGTVSDCPLDARGHFRSFSFALIEDLLGMSTVTDQIQCSKLENDTIATLLLELYLVMGTILLLNMLIAMMGQTFTEVRERQEEEYNFLNARIVISCDLEDGNIPPPLSVLRVPAKLAAAVHRALGGSVGSYSTLEEETSSSGAESGSDQRNASSHRSGDHGAYSHISAAELLEVVHEMDLESSRKDLAGLVLSTKQAVISELRSDEVVRRRSQQLSAPALSDAKATGSLESSASGQQASGVIVHDGFHEEASRLVFPYADHFQHLPANPAQRTFLPSGVSENEPKKLPIYVDDEAPDKAKGEPDMTRDEMRRKLQTRALTSYPYAQQVPMRIGQVIMYETGDAYVYKRDNGEYGLSQVWPIKFNEQFKKSFTCSTANPDPKIFNPQAVADFEHTMNRLFGDGATDRVPVVYAQSTRTNTLPLYRGTSEQLQCYLRANPAAVDKLKIAKLYPGGFVAVVSVGGNPSKGEVPKKDSFKHFDLTPGETYVLYTKQGYESMACVKSAFAFEKECSLGPVHREQATVSLAPPRTAIELTA